MLEQYQRELNKLLNESKDKGPDWTGWHRIETLEDIIAKYRIFEKIS